MAEPLLTAMTLPMITAAEFTSSPFSFQNTENSYTAPVSDLMEACQQPLVKAQRLVTVAIEICNSLSCIRAHKAMRRAQHAQRTLLCSVP